VNVATLRQTLKNYLSAHLRIDRWGVGLPANISDSQAPPSIAIDEPGKFEESGFFQGQGSPTAVTVAATFPFQVLYRFNSIYKYDQLPRGELEAKLMELRTILRQAVACELDDVLPGSFKTNSSVAIAQQENKDWLLVCKFTVICDLLCELQDIQITSGLFDAGVARVLSTLRNFSGSSVNLLVADVGYSVATSKVLDGSLLISLGDDLFPVSRDSTPMTKALNSSSVNLLVADVGYLIATSKAFDGSLLISLGDS